MEPKQIYGQDCKTRESRWLLLAGFVPLPWFLIWVGIAGLVSPGYSALSQQASELTLQPGLPHLMFDIGALGSGAGFCLFAIGLWRTTQKTFSFGAFAWLIFGASMLSNGIWPMGGPPQGLYGIGIISLLAPAVSLIELPMLRHTRTAYLITVCVEDDLKSIYSNKCKMPKSPPSLKRTTRAPHYLRLCSIIQVRRSCCE